MSSGSYSANNNRDDSYGQGGWQYSSSSYNEMQQPAQDGMTTQPSVGRFTEKEKANSMFARKPATPTMAPPKDSSQSGSSDIVNLNVAAGAERKMNVKNSSKGKK